MVDFGPESGDARYVPEMLVIGSLHGDERVGYEMALQLVEDLCTNYHKDFIITSVSQNILRWSISNSIPPKISNIGRYSNK